MRKGYPVMAVEAQEQMMQRLMHIRFWATARISFMTESPQP